MNVWLQIIEILVLAVAAWLAYLVGRKQNEINKNLLSIQDFVEIFVMPQSLVDNDGRVVGWNLLVKNASSGPIYMNRFTLNGISFSIGSSTIPATGENWYTIPVPKIVQETGKIALEIEFEDYLSRRYRSRHEGTFDVQWWIRSEKSEAVKL